MYLTCLFFLPALPELPSCVSATTNCILRPTVHFLTKKKARSLSLIHVTHSSPNKWTFNLFSRHFIPLNRLLSQIIGTRPTGLETLSSRLTENVAWDERRVICAAESTSGWWGISNAGGNYHGVCQHFVCKVRLPECLGLVGETKKKKIPVEIFE
jgi:hypothetical protein